MCLYCENIALLEVPSAADDGCWHAPLRHFLEFCRSQSVGSSALPDWLTLGHYYLSKLHWVICCTVHWVICCIAWSLLFSMHLPLAHVLVMSGHVHIAKIGWLWKTVNSQRLWIAHTTISLDFPSSLVYHLDWFQWNWSVLCCKMG